MAVDKMPGSEFRNTMRRKLPKTEHPSIHAASSRLMGMES